MRDSNSKLSFARIIIPFPFDDSVRFITLTLNYDNASITRIKNQINSINIRIDIASHIYTHIYICIYRSFKTILRSIVIIHQAFKKFDFMV